MQVCARYLDGIEGLVSVLTRRADEPLSMKTIALLNHGCHH